MFFHLNMILRLGLLASVCSVFFPEKAIAADDLGIQDLNAVSVVEVRGYPKREHSLIKPYQGSGMGIQNWDIVGSTIVSGSHIRLTSDLKSIRGAIWNIMPLLSRDWELQVNIKIHGSSGDLFGDGLAIWYTQDRSRIGDVFGSKDYFRGLGVFIDTYSNHNGPHSHGHPYISAMVSNGSLHYDHDRDGTHTQLGGEHVGCEAKLRNKDYDTRVLVRYVGDSISIYTDFENDGKWMKCLSVSGVRLPIGYYLGISAATGDLTDIHDLLSVRLTELDFARAEKEGEQDRRGVDPMADLMAAPRDHVSDPRPSQLGWIGTVLLILIAIAVIVVVLGFGLVFLQKRQEMSRKRFY